MGKGDEYTGKHRDSQDRTADGKRSGVGDHAAPDEGYALGSRTERPHDPNGWASGR